MSEMGVWRRWAAASSFWQETLSAVFGGMGLGDGSSGSTPSMPNIDPPSRPSSPFQGTQGSSSTPYQFTWDASNSASGMYFVKVQAKEFTTTQKLMLIK